jgi:threonine/homoserine/homoserine lactone efflux protein
VTHSLFIALVITLEPLPVIAFILVLGTDRGVRNGAAFIAGWIACLVVMIVGTLTLTGGQPLQESSAPATAGLVLIGLIGAGFLVLAGVRFRRPAGHAH